jgi:hypothetical protein
MPFGVYSSGIPPLRRPLVIGTALAAFSDYLDWLLPGLATILDITHLILSFAFTAVLFAMIFGSGLVRTGYRSDPIRVFQFMSANQDTAREIERRLAHPRSRSMTFGGRTVA